MNRACLFQIFFNCDIIEKSFHVDKWDKVRSGWIYLFILVMLDFCVDLE